MRLCLMLEGQEGVTWAEWVAIARAVEANGLDGLFRSDHYTSFHGPAGPALDAWATISALAAITERIRLGTLVSPATFRHPSELARVAVTADHVSGGRVEVGIGAGWFELEHRQNGFEFPDVKERYDRLTEYVEVLVRSWSANQFDFRGSHFELIEQRALPAPVQTPHPPLIIGGKGKSRSVALAAAYGSEYNAGPVTADQCRVVRSALDRACEAAGRDPGTLPLSVMGLLAVGATSGEADRRLARNVARFRPPRERWHAGTLEQTAELLARYEEAGVRRLYAQYPDRADFEAVAHFGELSRLSNDATP